MIAYKPVPFKMGQQAMPSAPASSPALPPSPDPLFTGYTGVPGILETLLVLGATGAAGWLGITTALEKSSSQPKKIAGWVGGVGAVLAGLLYLAGKSGLNQVVGLPAVRVTPV
jgi:hypothetical protein